MLYDAKTPNEYLNQLKEDWRKDAVLKIREIILREKNLNEGVEYKMLRYGNDESILFHLNAQKNYVSLYVGNINKIEGDRETLANFNLGKGCIRIQKSQSEDLIKIQKFIALASKKWNTGKELSY